MSERPLNIDIDKLVRNFIPEEIDARTGSSDLPICHVSDGTTRRSAQMQMATR